MTTNMTRCVETTLVSGMMCLYSVAVLPTWMMIMGLLCLLLVWLPNDIEIHI